MLFCVWERLFVFSSTHTRFFLPACLSNLLQQAKSGFHYGPERAEQLIVMMDEVDRENGGHGLLKPDVQSFTSLMDAYAQTNEWDGAVRSERILKRLLNEYRESGDAALEPNVASFSIVMGAWSRLARRKGQRNPGAAPRADQLLRLMEELHYDEGVLSFPPDAITYMTVLNAWALSRRDDGPAHAEKILDEMNEKYMDGDDTYRPSTKSVKKIVEGWITTSSNNDGDEKGIFRAEQFLQRYQDYVVLEYKDEEDDKEDDDDGEDNKNGDDTYAEKQKKSTTREIFQCMLFGWSKAGNPERSHAYLVEMVRRGLRPDSFSFDRVMEAYTQSFNKNDMDDDASARMANKIKQVFDLMEDCRKRGMLVPNERVYTCFIRALTKARVPRLAQKAVAVLKHMTELSSLEDAKWKVVQPTVFTYNAVLNACAESRLDENVGDCADAEKKNTESFRIALGVLNELRSTKSSSSEWIMSRTATCCVVRSCWQRVINEMPLCHRPFSCVVSMVL